MVACRFMENVIYQATEFSFIVVSICRGILRGKLYNYSCMEVLWRMGWRGK